MASHLQKQLYHMAEALFVHSKTIWEKWLGKPHSCSRLTGWIYTRRNCRKIARRPRIVERIADSGQCENEFRKFKEFCQMISPGGFRIAKETPPKQECKSNDTVLHEGWNHSPRPIRARCQSHCNSRIKTKTSPLHPVETQSYKVKWAWHCGWNRPFWTTNHTRESGSTWSAVPPAQPLYQLWKAAPVFLPRLFSLPAWFAAVPGLQQCHGQCFLSTVEDQLHGAWWNSQWFC